VPYPTGKTSDAYTPCVVLQPGQPPRRGSVAYVRLDSVDAARAKLAAGKVAWVSAGDVEGVLHLYRQVQDGGE
jgi:hypothetical protein